MPWSAWLLPYLAALGIADPDPHHLTRLTFVPVEEVRSPTAERMDDAGRHAANLVFESAGPALLRARCKAKVRLELRMHTAVATIRGSFSRPLRIPPRRRTSVEQESGTFFFALPAQRRTTWSIDTRRAGRDDRVQHAPHCTVERLKHQLDPDGFLRLEYGAGSLDQLRRYIEAHPPFDRAQMRWLSSGDAQDNLQIWAQRYWALRPGPLRSRASQLRASLHGNGTIRTRQHGRARSTSAPSDHDAQHKDHDAQHKGHDAQHDAAEFVEGRDLRFRLRGPGRFFVQVRSGNWGRDGVQVRDGVRARDGVQVRESAEQARHARNAQWPARRRLRRNDEVDRWLCIEVDGNPYCQSKPAATPAKVSSALADAPDTARSWRGFLSQGEHTITVPGHALVRGTFRAIGAEHIGSLPPARGIAVFPPTCKSLTEKGKPTAECLHERWQPRLSIEAPEQASLMLPWNAPGGSPLPTSLWLEPHIAAAIHPRWLVHDEQELHFWLPVGELCEIHFAGSASRFLSVPQQAWQRFLWNGTGPPAVPVVPQAEGCKLRIRATFPAGQDGAVTPAIARLLPQPKQLATSTRLSRFQWLEGRTAAQVSIAALKAKVSETHGTAPPNRDSSQYSASYTHHATGGSGREQRVQRRLKVALPATLKDSVTIRIRSATDTLRFRIRPTPSAQETAATLHRGPMSTPILLPHRFGAEPLEIRASHPLAFRLEEATRLPAAELDLPERRSIPAEAATVASLVAPNGSTASSAAEAKNPTGEKGRKRSSASADNPVRSAATANASLQASLRQLSKRIAAEQSAEERADAYLARAVHLADAGYATFALQDFRAAAIEDPTPEHQEQLRAMRDKARLSSILAPRHGWIPTSDFWLRSPEHWASSARRLETALRTRDFLTIAKAHSIDRYDRMYAWQQAIVLGQVLRGEERMRAYLDLLRFVPQAHHEHPMFAPIRSQSAWHAIRSLDGAKYDGMRPWTRNLMVLQKDTEARAPKQSHASTDLRGEDIGDALYPTLWPSEEILPMGKHRRLRLLPRDKVKRFEARCRGTDRQLAKRAAKVCALQVYSWRGDLLHSVALSSHGIPEQITVPKSRGPVDIAFEGSGPGRTQLRLPRDLVNRLLPGGNRITWRLPAKRPASFLVVGPTSLRIHIDPHKATEFAARIERAKASSGAGAAPSTLGTRVHRQRVTKASVWELAIRQRGRVRVSLESQIRAKISLAIRVPRVSSYEPWTDRNFLADRSAQHQQGASTGQGPDGAFDTPRQDAPLQHEEPEGQRQDPMVAFLRNIEGLRIRPAPAPALTGLASLRIGGVQTLDEAEQDTQLRVQSGAGLSARLASHPIWIDGELRSSVAVSGEAIGELRGGMEGWWNRQQSRTHLRLDLRGGFGRPGDEALTTFHLTAFAQQGHWLGQHVLLAGGLRYTERHRLPRSNLNDFGEQPTLWSTYKEDHRRVLAPELQLRLVPTRWLWLSTKLSLISNEQVFEKPDYMRAELYLDKALPRIWLRGGAFLDRRFADRDRSQAFTSPVLLAKGLITLWPHGHLGIQIGLEGRYQVRFRSVTALALLRLALSRDRGLADLRPSRFPFKDAAVWDQDRAALKRAPRLLDTQSHRKTGPP